MSFDFLLLYKKEGNEIPKKGKEENKAIKNEFAPIKINYDNDDIYRRFNDLAPLYTPKRKFFRRNNPLQAFSIFPPKKKNKYN